MELKKTIEVIEYNPKTQERQTHSFDEYYQAIGFLKRREEKVNSGYTYTICELTMLIKVVGGNK